MLYGISVGVNLLFAFTVVAATVLFLTATNWSKRVLLILSGWILLQSIISVSGFYLITDTLPPRFVIAVLPPLFTVLLLFFTRAGKRFMDGMDTGRLTLFHTIRIPVELILYWLFIEKKIPELMTFSGRNFDILSGLSAPLVYYFGFRKKWLNKKFLLIWNMVCLGLLLNIVINAALSVPFPFQQFAFDQPNVAVLYFPFCLLPALIVPMVLFSHLAAIRQLLISRS